RGRAARALGGVPRRDGRGGGVPRSSLDRRRRPRRRVRPRVLRARRSRDVGAASRGRGSRSTERLRPAARRRGGAVVTRRLAWVLALWFGCGRVPLAPGTAGTLGA